MSQAINWKDLGFSYMQTKSFLRCDYIQGAWGDVSVCTDPYFSIHVAATCFHYGQACFEGLKAFRRKDGSIGIFRPDENARRMMSTAVRLVMEAPSVELFVKIAQQLVRENVEFVPPYGTGASMYLRPVLMGSSPHVGVHPSEDYLFFMLAMPVGPYYKEGFFPVPALIVEEFDRAAPRGVGNVKAAGNYAAAMYADKFTKSKGYPISLFLDSAKHEYIDEFGTSNFIGITKDNTFVTPESTSILPSITNKSLQQLAEHIGLKVERRPVHVKELKDFAEVGACGTAAVITPVYSITHGNKVYTYGKEKESGKTLTRLFFELQKIQYGESDDIFNWMVTV